MFFYRPFNFVHLFAFLLSALSFGFFLGCCRPNTPIPCCTPCASIFFVLRAPWNECFDIVYSPLLFERIMITESGPQTSINVVIKQPPSSLSLYRSGQFSSQGFPSIGQMIVSIEFTPFVWRPFFSFISFMYRARNEWSGMK